MGMRHSSTGMKPDDRRRDSQNIVVLEIEREESGFGEWFNVREGKTRGARGEENRGGLLLNAL